MSGNTRDKENSGRVYITYDVHTGGARVKRELPFVVGVIGDFAGSASWRRSPNGASSMSLAVASTPSWPGSSRR